MRFAFTDDQTLFAEGLRDLLAKECTPAHVRAAWDDGAGHDLGLWNHLTEMGVFGMLVPEAAGGLGGTEVDLVLLLEELGRAAVPGPVFETAAVVAPVLGDGATVGTAALDGSPYVPHAHVASVVLVPGGVMRPQGATLVPVEAIDGGRRLFTVEGIAVEPLDYDEALAFDRGALAAAAYLVGLSERMIDVSAEYARQREQYGRPIGVNQAVKHLLADALLKVEFAKPAVYRAAWSIAEREPTRSRDVSMAKAFASDAAYRSSRSAMQVHGAIGYTWEADLQLWMKKAWALQRAWGDATFHRRRVADAVIGAGGVTRADLEFGTIPRLVRASATRFPDLDALVDGELRLTFPELAARIEESARAFIAAGIEPGDRVGMWAPNIGAWVIAALGALGAGGVLVPLNTRFKGTEAAFVLGRSGARFLCTVNGFLETDYVSMLREAGPVPDTLERILVLQGDAPDETTTFADFLARAGEVSVETARARADTVGPDDVADIIFTSGTTGKPKGAMTAHAQTLRTFDAWANTVGLVEGDRYLVVNPFFHTFGYKAGIVACFIKGATIVPEPVFDVPAVLAHVASERISMLPGPPTLYLSILDHPDRDSFDLSSLRLAVTGAAPVPVEMIRRMREELTFRTIVTAYGLTESTGTVSICRPDDDPETISHTSGRAIDGLEVRVVDDDGTELPRREPGEIVCRGFNVMLGYFEDDAATRDAIDADGWLHTGDIGVMDDRGYLQITDRKKDMFIVGGFNVYPAEVENAILEHPDVAQVAVVSAPDPRMGEVGVAFVVPRSGASIDPDELCAWCAPRMANYKVPRRAVVVDTLPVNASGKVLKFELRERA